MNTVLIWGCGGHAREVNYLCELLGVRVAGFLDERPEMQGRVVDGITVLGRLHDALHLRSEASVICAGVGDPALRKRFSLETQRLGFCHSRPMVHPQVHVSQLSSIGQGSVICAGVTMTVNVRIGAHVVVNRNATLGHDVTVGDFSTISPGVCVSGNVEVGEGAYLGTGSSLREKLRVGEWSVVGGGAFVLEDVPPRTLVAGVPAVVKKSYE